MRIDLRLFVLDFFLYCEYELLHLILEVEIVCSIAGVARVNALVRSLFCVYFLCLGFNTLVLFVNYIRAFKYYKGLNFLLLYLLFYLDFGREVDLGVDLLFWLGWWFLFFISYLNKLTLLILSLNLNLYTQIYSISNNQTNKQTIILIKKIINK